MAMEQMHCRSPILRPETCERTRRKNYRSIVSFTHPIAFNARFMMRSARYSHARNVSGMPVALSCTEKTPRVKQSG